MSGCDRRDCRADDTDALYAAHQPRGSCSFRRSARIRSALIFEIGEAQVAHIFFGHEIPVNARARGRGEGVMVLATVAMSGEAFAGVSPSETDSTEAIASARLGRNTHLSMRHCKNVMLSTRHLELLCWFAFMQAWNARTSSRHSPEVQTTDGPVADGEAWTRQVGRRRRRRRRRRGGGLEHARH